MRSPTGQFQPMPEEQRLGRTFGVRIFQRLEPELKRLALESGLTETEYIRAVVHQAIADQKIIHMV